MLNITETLEYYGGPVSPSCPMEPALSVCQDGTARSPGGPGTAAGAGREDKNPMPASRCQRRTPT